MAVTMDKLERYLSRHAIQTDVDSPRLLREIAYERLKDGLRHADLMPGEPLSEIRISKALGISRTPVREALQQLAHEGLVQVIPGRAVTVASPSIQQVLDAVHVRILLEPEAARLAAESITPADAEALWESLHEMEQAAEDNNREVWSKADSRLHQVMIDTCPNELLGQIVLQMRNRAHYAALDSQTTPSRIKACTQEHRRIVEAIASHDSQAAELAMQEHLKQLWDSLFSRARPT